MTVNTGQTQATINVTPMIDVLLVLLIIFMAISPATPNGLDATIPQPATNATAALEAPVVLEIAGDGSYRLNSKTVPFATLNGRLSAVFNSRADRVLFVKAAATLEYSVVAAAIDVAHGANIDRVALMPR